MNQHRALVAAGPMYLVVDLTLGTPTHIGNRDQTWAHLTHTATGGRHLTQPEQAALDQQIRDWFVAADRDGATVPAYRHTADTVQLHGAQVPRTRLEAYACDACPEAAA